MSLDDVLREFGSRTGLGQLARNRDGICRLVFDGGLVVDLEAKDDKADVSITAAVGPLGGDVGTAALRDFLAANLMIDENGGAALGLDLTRDELVLCRQLPSEGLNYATFERTLERFLTHLQRCRAHLNATETSATSESLVGIEGDQMLFLRA